MWCVSGNVLFEVKYISILLANLFTSVDILHFDFPFLNLFSHIVIVDMKRRFFLVTVISVAHEIQAVLSSFTDVGLTCLKPNSASK